MTILAATGGAASGTAGQITAPRPDPALVEIDETQGVDVGDVPIDFEQAWETLPAGASQSDIAAARTRVRAVVESRIAAYRLAESRPAGFAQDDSDDPVEDTIEQVGGTGSDEENPMEITQAAGGCAIYGYYKKRKLPFTPLYSSVRAHLEYVCSHTIAECVAEGAIGPAAFALVFGAWVPYDGVNVNWCEFDTSKAYLVNRVFCFGIGGAQTAFKNGQVAVGAWAGKC